MNSEEISRRLNSIFRDVFDRDDIVVTRQTTSVNIEDWDSLANISLIVAIEKEFGITFNLAEVKALQDVGGMMDLIQTKAKLSRE